MANQERTQHGLIQTIVFKEDYMLSKRDYYKIVVRFRSIHKSK